MAALQIEPTTGTAIWAQDLLTETVSLDKGRDAPI